MSKSLVKKAFALAEQELSSSRRKTDEKATKRKASALELIPRHQKLVQIVGKKGKKVEKDLVRRREKLTVTDVREELANRRDPTDDNVKKLLMLTSSNLDDVSRETIIKRARTGHYVSRVRVPKSNRNKYASTTVTDDTDNQGAAGESVFTEDDFANFAKELEKSGLLQ
ncbi:uncharacterized protein LOC128715021 [Anopheles marshallii]|uniref:uncharacterized protein LOC128715021 n=1 Tax=Anopheles marshallii TaxID=1521116 RepID=UPI00237BD6B8|nr:uncharacterized protein LOC128715021 [Anopheles marshallii]